MQPFGKCADSLKVVRDELMDPKSSYSCFATVMLYDFSAHTVRSSVLITSQGLDWPHNGSSYRERVLRHSRTKRRVHELDRDVCVGSMSEVRSAGLAGLRYRSPLV